MTGAEGIAFSQECTLMSRKDPKGDVRTNGSIAGRPTAGNDDARDSVRRANPVESTAADGARVAESAALSYLLMRDDGWLRASPDGEGKAVFIKWKFTRGKFAGTYVMVVVSPWSIGSAWPMLQGKIDGCYAGTRRPTKDSSYTPIIDDGFPG